MEEKLSDSLSSSDEDEVSDEEKVACVPGTAFGNGGEGYLRLSYCYSDEELEEGLKRIERFIKTLNKCKEITIKEYKDINVIFKICGRVLKLIAPLM